MHLTQYTDFALRALIALAVSPDERSTVSQISSAYGISRHHLVKVAGRLAELGYIESTRGKGGGLRLAMAAHEIVLGEVIRHTESDFNLVECFASNASCRIQGACCLNSILDQAVKALFQVLDRYTLADLLVNPQGLIPLQAATAHDPGRLSGG